MQVLSDCGETPVSEYLSTTGPVTKAMSREISFTYVRL